MVGRKNQNERELRMNPRNDIKKKPISSSSIWLYTKMVVESSDALKQNLDNKIQNEPQIIMPASKPTFGEHVDKLRTLRKITFRERLWASFCATFGSAVVWLWEGAGNIADHIATYFRNWMVVDDCVENHSNNTTPNNNSLFYQDEFKHGQGSSLTPLGYFTLIISMLAHVIGMFQVWYSKFNLISEKSEDRFKERLEDRGFKFKSDASFEKTMRNFEIKLHKKGKIINRTKVNYVYLDAKGNESEEEKANIKNNYDPYNFPDTWWGKLLKGIVSFMDLFNANFHVDEKNWWTEAFNCEYETKGELPKEETLTPGEKILSYLSFGIRGFCLPFKWVYNQLNDHAFLFWIVFIPFTFAVGIIKTSVSLFYTKLVMAGTLGLGLLYNLPKLIKWISNAGKSKEELLQDKLDDECKEEAARQEAEFRYYAFVKAEHAKKNDYLRTLKYKHENNLADDDETAVTKVRNENNYDEIANEEYKQESTINILPLDRDKVQNSKLFQRLTKNSYWRVALGMLIEGINTLIAVSFMFWFGESFVYSFLPDTHSSIYQFFDSATISGGTDIALGLFAAILKGFNMRTAQLQYEQKIEERLREEYKGPGHRKNETKLEAFERFEKEAEFKKARAEWLRLRILINEAKRLNKAKNECLIKTDSANKQFTDFGEDLGFDLGNKKLNAYKTAEDYKDCFNTLSEERKALEKSVLEEGFDAKRLSNLLASEVNLEEIDPWNTEIIEKQRYEASTKTWFERITTWIFTLLAGGQSGILFARTLFGGGCIFGGLGLIFGTGAVIVGTVGSGGTLLAAFIGIAVTCTILYGIVRLGQFFVERYHQHQKNYLENLTGEINFLQKTNKDLDLLDNILVTQVNCALPLSQRLESIVSNDQIHEKEIKVVQSAEKVVYKRPEKAEGRSNIDLVAETVIVKNNAFEAAMDVAPPPALNPWSQKAGSSSLFKFSNNINDDYIDHYIKNDYVADIDNPTVVEKIKPGKLILGLFSQKAPTTASNERDESCSTSNSSEFPNISLSSQEI